MGMYEDILISLIRSAISPEYKASVPADCDLEKIAALAEENIVVPLVWYGLANSGINIPDKIRAKLEYITYRSVILDQRQISCFNEISTLFSENNISFMPIKGILIKRLYPKTEMRPMGDIDILIHNEDYNKIKLLMKNLGYCEIKETDHEFIWLKGDVCIEFHKHLIPSYNDDYYEYYKDSWKHAKKSDDNRNMYKLEKEDCFVFLITHFAKHYRDGGIGITHLLDIYIYLKNINVDMLYINKELKKISLDVFCDNVIKTAESCFSGTPKSNITNLIITRTFSNGIWGTTTSQALASAARENSGGKSLEGVKKRRFINLLFPTADYLKFRYPILQEHKCFLPIVWVTRIISTLIFKRSNLKKRISELNKTDIKSVSDYQISLKAVGLDFNLGKHRDNSIADLEVK